MPSKDCTIRYFRAERGSTDGRWPRSGDVRTTIHNAVGTTAEDPYIEHGNNHYIVEAHASKPLHVSVATVRRDNLPLLEHQGRTSALPLAKGDNLAEPTHFLFFGDRIVAMVRGQLTPAHFIGGNVLSKRCNIDLAFAPILRPEIEALVMNSLAVTKLEIRVAGSSFDRAAADAGDPVEAVRMLTGRFSGAAVATVGVVAKNGPDRQRLRSWVIRQLQTGQLRSGRGVEMARANVLDRDGQLQVVDLIEDQIAHKTTVVTSGVTRYLDAEDVRRVVLENFEEQRGVLTRAIELSAD